MKKTALYYAAERGMLGQVEDLVAAGGEDLTQIVVYEALEVAILNGYPEIVKVLYGHLNPEYPLPVSHTRAGILALFTAINYNRFAIVDYLLSQGVDVNGRDSGGDTALIVAVKGEKEDGYALCEVTGYCEPPDARMTELLLNHGADVHVINKHGEYPLSIARAFHPKAERLLRNKGAR